MRPRLLFPDRDFSPSDPGIRGRHEMAADLEVEVLVRAMSGDDTFIADVSRAVILDPLVDPVNIAYRQAVLRDLYERPLVAQILYDTAVAGIDQERKVYGGIFRSAGSSLHRSLQVHDAFKPLLHDLRNLADAELDHVRSDSLVEFFGMIRSVLDDEFFARLESHTRVLRGKRGVVLSACFGPGLKGRDYLIRVPGDRPGWFDRLLGRDDSLSFQIAERDEAGARALAALRDRGLTQAAYSLAQSVDHIRDFFISLRTELAFYLGCLRLRSELSRLGAPVCVPEPVPLEELAFSGAGLYDVCLALQMGSAVVGNDVCADGVSFVVVTGANQGGKSTFLRSVGVAHLMMQCGMFVGARSLRASTCARVLTHYKREEDASMTSGKFDEELARMRSLVKALVPGSLVLSNESFASTNEQEGSEVGRKVFRALVESGVRVFAVTHMYDMAHGFLESPVGPTLFLRAGREDDGSRTFRLEPGEPLTTSFGEDLYRQVFGTDDAA